MGTNLDYIYSFMFNTNGLSLRLSSDNESIEVYKDDYDENKVTQLYFEWYKHNGEVNNPTDIINDEILQKYRAREEGYYYGRAVTKRNGEVKKSDNYTKYRVTKPIKNPADYFTLKGVTTPNLHEGVLGNQIIIDFHKYDESGNMISSFKHDSIKYQWYKYDSIDNTGFIPVNIDGSSGYVDANGLITFSPHSTGEYKVALYIERNKEVYGGNNVNIEDTNTWPFLQYYDSNIGTYKSLIIDINPPSME